MDMLVRYARQSKFYFRYRASERAVCLQIKVVVWPKMCFALYMCFLLRHVDYLYL